MVSHRNINYIDVLGGYGLELKYLYTVKRITELGSYQKAAQDLSYTQSTISFHVSQLEKELSIKLFEKFGRKMVLTQAGTEALQIIERILDSVEQLQQCSKNAEELNGLLKIAIPETLLTYKIQSTLKAYKIAAPNVKLSLQALNCYVIREQLLSGDADLVIHYDVGGYTENIMTSEIGAYSLVLVASPDFPLECRDFITPHQRKPICHISNDPNGLFLKIFNRYLHDKDITLETSLEVYSIEAIKRSVMSNLGVAFLPRFTVENELLNGSLLEIETELTDKKIIAICAYHKNKWVSPSMALFLQILGESFNLN